LLLGIVFKFGMSDMSHTFWNRIHSISTANIVRVRRENKRRRNQRSHCLQESTWPFCKETKKIGRWYRIYFLSPAKRTYQYCIPPFPSITHTLYSLAPARAQACEWRVRNYFQSPSVAFASSPCRVTLSSSGRALANSGERWRRDDACLAIRDKSTHKSNRVPVMC